jgi:hypothetical protein
VLKGDRIEAVVVHSADRRKYLLPAAATIGEPI